MPSEKSSRVLQTRTKRNRMIRSAVRTRIAAALQAIESGSTEGAQTLVARAASALDRAANKGVVHPNNASRRKARLAKRLHSLTPKS